MFKAWNKTEIYQDHLKSTQAEIKALLSQYESISIAVSGGKDSLVLLDLILTLNPNVWVWHWDYGIFMIRKFEEEILTIFQNYFHLSERLIVDKRTSQNLESNVGYRSFFAAITNHLKTHNIQSNFIGLRQEESCRRKNRASQLLEPSNPCPNAFPLRKWTWKDIWSYLIVKQIPYPSAYDTRGPILGWDKVRFVTFFDPEFAHLGSIEQDKFFFYNQR